ncbi:MAG: heavy metal-associated domain-containing protein [Flavobacterium sp.]|jgi:copper chaperone CopZ
MKNLNIIMLVVFASIVLLSCKNDSTNTNEVTPIETTTDTLSAVETAANLKTESFTIEGMTCEIGCAKTIESKLANLEGVEEAKVDFENKTATISFDEAKQNKASLIKTINAVAGGNTYKATEVENKKTI